MEGCGGVRDKTCGTHFSTCMQFAQIRKPTHLKGDPSFSVKVCFSFT